MTLPPKILYFRLTPEIRCLSAWITGDTEELSAALRLLWVREIRHLLHDILAVNFHYLISDAGMLVSFLCNVTFWFSWACSPGALWYPLPCRYERAGTSLQKGPALNDTQS